MFKEESLPSSSGKHTRKFKIDIVLVGVLFFIAGVFLFKNLGNTYLNVDEAETALLAKSILKNGVPKGIDGKFRIQQNKASPFKDEKSKVWIFHPWLQFYVPALSYISFGKINTFTARFPFSLIGFLFVLFFYRSLKGRKRFEVFFVISALALLVFSIPFYLYARQCRYYVLNIFFSFGIFISYIKILESGKRGERKEKFYFILFSLLLFYSNYATFFAMYASVFFHMCTFHFKKIKKIIIPSLIIAAISLPGIVFFEIWKRKEVVYKQDTTHFINILQRSIRYVGYINSYHIPGIFFLIFLILLIFKRKHKEGAAYFKDDFFTASFTIISINILFFSSVILHDYRLFVHLIPFLVIILAGGLNFLKREILPNWCVILFLFVLVSGNYINLIPLDIFLYLAPFKATEKQLQEGKVYKSMKLRPFYIDPELKKNFFLRTALIPFPNFKWYRYIRIREMSLNRYSVLDYIYEITHNYNGPIKGTVKFLEKNANPGDKVKIFYGDLSLQFYLGNTLEVIPRFSFHDNIYPRWWVLRQKKWRYLENEKEEVIYEERILEKHYTPYKLKGYPDSPFNNLPSPEYHFFRTPTQRRREMKSDRLYDMLIFCRKDALPYAK